MIKHFCDLCGRELNSNNYTYGGIEINTSFRIITLDDVCDGCTKRFKRLQKMKL